MNAVSFLAGTGEDRRLLAATLEVGLFVNADSWYDQATARFDSVSLTTP